MHGSRMTEAAMAVPRISPPSAATFQRDYVEQSRPAILQGIVETWPAFRRWSFDHMREEHGSRRVPLSKTREGTVIHDPWTGIHLEEIPMRQAIDRMCSGESGCYLMASVEQYLQPLLKDVVVPEYCHGQTGLQSRLWVSPADIGTPMHRDFPENLLAQIRGRKRVILYPPHDTPLLYSFPSRSRLPNFSAADAERPDHERFPLLREAQRIELLLEAGEMLYLPSRWWHQVRSLEASISFNFWWAAGVYRWLLRARQGYQAMMGAREQWRRR